METLTKSFNFKGKSIEFDVNVYSPKNYEITVILIDGFSEDYCDLFHSIREEIEKEAAILAAS